MRSGWKSWITLSCLALPLSGCDLPDIETFANRVNSMVGFQLLKVHQKGLPSEVKEEMSQAASGPSGMTAGQLAKANSELLSEMMKVVFHAKDIENKSEFGGLVSSLNQGASLEGIYHGLIMGSRYRSLEANEKSASPRVLKAFVYEMVELQSSMKNPTEFEAEDARHAPTIEFPNGEGTPPSVASKGPSQEVKAQKDKKVMMNELLQLFIGASNYTLKRVLGDEALKKFDELKDSQGELAQWYAQLVLRFTDTHVDFGLEQRNRPDFDFHFKFAQTMAPDRVKWEVLNRYHRYLNFVIEHEN